MDLKALQKEAHANAKDHGWWDATESPPKAPSYSTDAHRSPQSGRTFGDCIALVHSELSEALEAYRVCGIVDCPHEHTEGAGAASELADVVIRVADMAEHYHWDLSGWEDADISHTIVDPTFGDWICLIHASLTWAFAGLCTTLQRSEWIEPLKVALRLVSDMAAHYGIDLDAAIEAKMEYNRTRPYRHGGKAL